MIVTDLAHTYPTATGREVQQAMVEGSPHLHERKESAYLTLVAERLCLHMIQWGGQACIDGKPASLASDAACQRQVRTLHNRGAMSVLSNTSEQSPVRSTRPVRDNGWRR